MEEEILRMYNEEQLRLMLGRTHRIGGTVGNQALTLSTRQPTSPDAPLSGQAASGHHWEGQRGRQRRVPERSPQSVAAPTRGFVQEQVGLRVDALEAAASAASSVISNRHRLSHRPQSISTSDASASSLTSPSVQRQRFSSLDSFDAIKRAIESQGHDATSSSSDDNGVYSQQLNAWLRYASNVVVQPPPIPPRRHRHRSFCLRAADSGSFCSVACRCRVHAVHASYGDDVHDSEECIL